MDQVVAEAPPSAAEEADDVIGPPAAMAHPPPAVAGAAGHGKGNPVAGIVHGGLYFPTQLRGGALVGIDRENPLLRGKGKGAVLLPPEAGPVGGEMHLIRIFAAQLHRPVRAAGIDDDHLVGPGDGREALADTGLLVFRDYNDG